MKHSKSLILGVACSLMIVLLGMSSCAKSTSDQQAPNAVEIWEAYNAVDLFPALDAINETTMESEQPLHSILHGLTTPEGTIIGVAFYNDTAAINEVLQSEYAKSLLPEDLCMAWTKEMKPGTGIHGLIALKPNNGGPLYAENIIKDVVVEDYYGPVVTIIPTEEGLAKVEELEEAYGDRLYLVIHGAPCMLAKENGKIYVTVMFEEQEEAEEFAKTIK